MLLTTYKVPGRRWNGLFVRIVLLAAMILVSLHSFAGVEPFTNSMHGKFAKGDTLVVRDEKFRSPYYKWNDIQKQKVANIISFQLFQDTSAMLPKAFSCNLKLKIEYFTSPDQPEPLLINNVNLSIRYKADSLQNNKLLDTYNFEHGHWVKITIEEVNSPEFGTEIPPFLQLTSQVIVDRKYKFDPTKKLGAVYQLTSTDERGTQTSEADGSAERFTGGSGFVSYGIRMIWDAVGYDEFDLEWTTLDKLSGYDDKIQQIQNGTITQTALNELFRFKSTRITTHANNYTVTLTHYNSYMLFRIRSVQYNDGVRLEGDWDYIQGTGTAHAFFDIETYWHEPNLNWQFSASYAEDGKKKEVIEYSDGAFRSRQTVTISDNRDQVDIVEDNKRNAAIQEHVYDQFGRVVASILPAPINQSVFAYYPRQNLSEAGQLYTWQNVKAGEGCETKPDKLSTSGGAGKYYSPANGFGLTGMNKYIPDAEGYPLAVTRYTPDNTGRIKIQGGVGNTLQPTPSDSRTTKYYYGKPDQSELDRLFGNDVGYAEHYLKNMVIDANGQASVSYIDPSGKTIATAFSGEAPPNLEGLPGKPAPTFQTKTIIRPRQFQYDFTNLTMKASATYLSAVTGSATLSFDIEKLIYEYTKPGWSFCSNCYYDLTIKVFDDCGLPVYTTTVPKQIGSDQLGCNNSGTHTEDIPVNLPKRGEYQISFEFALSRNVVEKYTEAYIEERKLRGDWKTEFRFVDDYIKLENFNSCFSDCATCDKELGTKSAFVSNAKNQLTNRGIASSPAEDAEMSTWLNNLYDNLWAQCQTLKANCNYSPCDHFKKLMLTDVSPGGQYALFGNSSSPLEQEINVLYLHWRTEFPVLYVGHPDYESSIIETDDGTRTSPHDPYFTLEMLVMYWKPEWAEKFLKYHPEYCKLEFCNNNSNYFNWDNQVNEEIETAAAIPTHHATLNHQYSNSLPTWLVNADPFFQAGGLGYAYANDMRADLQQFASRILKVTAAADKSITQFVDYLIYCINPEGNTNAGNTADTWNSCSPVASCRIPDREWALYKEWYFQAKEKYYELARKATTCANACEVGSPIIIPPFNGCPKKEEFSILAASSLINYNCPAGQVPVKFKYLRGNANGTITLTIQYSPEFASWGLPSSIVFNNGESEKIICLNEQVPLSSIYITGVACSGSTPPDPNYCPFGNGGTLSISGSYQQLANNKFVVTNTAAGTRTTYTIVSGSSNLPPADNVYCPAGTVVLKQYYNCYKVYLPNNAAPLQFFNVWVIACQEDLCANATVFNFSRQISDFVFSADGYYYYIQASNGGTEPPCPNPYVYPTVTCLKVYVAGSPTPIIFTNATVKRCNACEINNTQSIYVTQDLGNYTYQNNDGTYYVYLNTTPNQIMSTGQCSNWQRSWVSCLIVNLNGNTSQLNDATVFFCPNAYNPCENAVYIYANPGYDYNHYTNFTYYTYPCSYSTVNYYVYEGYSPNYPPWPNPYCSYYGDGGWWYYECVKFIVYGVEYTYTNAWVWQCYEYVNNCGGGGGGGGCEVKIPQLQKAMQARGISLNGSQPTADIVPPCELERKSGKSNLSSSDRYYLGFTDNTLYLVRPVGSVMKESLRSKSKPGQVKTFTDWLYKDHFYVRLDSSRYINIRNAWVAEYAPEIKVQTNKKSNPRVKAAAIGCPQTQYFAIDQLDPGCGYNESLLTITYVNGVLPPGNSAFVTIQGYDGYTYGSVQFDPGMSSVQVCISNDAFESGIYLCSDYEPGGLPPQCPDILRNKNPRFTVIDFNLPLFDINGMVATGIQDMQQQIRNSCEGMADSWMSALEPCFLARGLSTAQRLNIRQKLIDVCVKGGDDKHPYGASTTRPGEVSVSGYSSFKAVILGELGMSSPDMICNPWLLESPYPWATKPQAVEQTIAATTPEICQKLATLQLQHANTNPGISFFQFLTNTYGASNVNVTETELNYIIKGCTNCKYLLDKEVPLPVFLEPDAKGCIVKSEWDAALAAFNAEYVAGVLNTGHDNYPDIFSTYLNHRWGFTLSYDDYIEYQNKLLTQPQSILCNEPVYTPIVLNPYQCVNSLLANAITNGQRDYEVYVETQKRIFRMNYVNTCLAAKSNVRLTSQEQEYHYTLYYYDQSEYLVKTVPPAGVVPLGPSQLSQVENAREFGGTPIYPIHTMATTYFFNSMGQVVTQSSPDAGTSNFWFDRMSRLVASQNAEQLAPVNGGPPNRYSYNVYDDLGRVTEVGEKESISLTMPSPGYLTDVQKTTFHSGGINKSITQTIFDQPATGSGVLTGLGQSNLRKKVSATIYKSISWGAAEQATYYSYDLGGNVKTLWQQIAGLGQKRMDYEYDLASGKLNGLRYQDGQPDRFFYQYAFDAENKLLKVYSGTEAIITLNGNIDIRNLPTTHVDAEYKYYLHGPLARAELGQQKVQGIDYAYTIQGWVKGINAHRLDPLSDMGEDGQTGNPVVGNNGRDVMAFSLGYFGGDFKPIGGVGAIAFGTVFNAPVSGKGASLFNGNIGHSTLALSKINNGELTGYTYKYDQLNRILSMNYHEVGSNNSWNNTTGLSTQKFNETYAYDGNGNIQTLTRNGHKPSTPLMDDLTYHYTAGTNRLDYIHDNIDENVYTDVEVKDLERQVSGNYSYDKIGNLKSDYREGINSVTWTAYGKINTITKSNGAFIQYAYDASGIRVSKTATVNGVPATTYYVRDAQGQTLAIYEGNNRTEQLLYGNRQLGVWKEGIGGGQPSRQYEIQNHLGNVIATVSQNKIAMDPDNNGIIDFYDAEVITQTDYYPFGMGQPGRNFSYGSSYRYAFNGQEITRELGENFYEAKYWEYDSRIAKRWNVDPVYKESESNYSVLGNNPLVYIDPLGLDWYKNDKTGEAKWFEGKGKHKGYTYLGDKDYVFTTKNSQLKEVVVTAVTKVPKKPMTPEYSKAFLKQINTKKVKAMLVGLSTVGNRLFESPYDPYKILNQTPEQKQQIFTQSAKKTLAILFSEFVEGTGRQTREFDQNTPITQEIANSYTTSLFFDYFYPLYKSGAFNDGVERMHTVFTSPDNAGSVKSSVKAHAQVIWNLSAFFTGSLDYYFRVSGNTLVLRVHNEFSISSGVSRNKADDLHRVPGHDSPLGNTDQYFNFTVDLDKLKRK